MESGENRSPVTKSELHKDFGNMIKQTLEDLESINAVNPIRHTVRQALRDLRREVLKKLEDRGYERG